MREFQIWQDKEGRKEMLYLTTHSTHFIYGYMVSEREEIRCHHMGYSFRLATRVLLCARSHRQNSTYHGLCYTSRGALAGTGNSSMCPPHEGSIRRLIAPWANALTMELQNVNALGEKYLLELQLKHRPTAITARSKNEAVCKLKTTTNANEQGVVPHSDLSYLRLILIFTSVPRNSFKTIVNPAHVENKLSVSCNRITNVAILSS